MCNLGPLLAALGGQPRVSKKDRVARLLMQGLDYQAVAERAGVSVGTVKVYASNLKLNRKHAKRRAEAAAEEAIQAVRRNGVHILPAVIGNPRNPSPARATRNLSTPPRLGGFGESEGTCAAEAAPRLAQKA